VGVYVNGYEYFDASAFGLADAVVYVCLRVCVCMCKCICMFLCLCMRMGRVRLSPLGL